MKLKHLPYLILLCPFFAIGQKGPGGIGGTNGTSNLIMWLDANSITDVSYGNNVTTWTDLSGFGNNASQSTPIQKPNWRTDMVNGYPALTFDGSERLEGTLHQNLNAPATMIVVTFFDSLNQGTSNNDYAFSIGSQNTDNSAMNIARRAGGVAQADQYFNFDGLNYNYGPTITGQTWNILTQTQNSVSPFHSFYMDGNQETVDDLASGSLGTNQDFRIADWADSPGGSFHMSGDIPEVILFDRVLSSAELNILHAYLGAKYDIRIEGDKYVGDSSIHQHNDHNVIGIGTEADGSNLNARAGGLILIQNSNFDNGDYVIAGHNVLENTINTTDIATGYDARWDRAWWFDITDANSSLTTDIHFDYRDAGIGSKPTQTTIANYQLIYRASNAGAWTTIASATTIDNDIVTFDNVALTLDGYYTIATLDNAISPLGQSPVATTCNGPAGVEDIDGTTNLKLWLNPDAMHPEDGDEMAIFTDFSGYNNHADSMYIYNIPTLRTNVVNGMDVALFDNSYAEGQLDVALGSPSTVIAVSYFENDQAANDNDYVISIGDPATASQHTSIGRRKDGLNQYYSWDGGSVYLGPVINTQEWTILYQENTTSGNFHNLYFNGAVSAVPAYSSAFNAVSTTYRVGEWQNGNNSKMDGYIGEIIIFDKILSLVERNIIHSYLSAKFNIAVTDDKYTGDDVSNGNHDIHVVGIGTETDGSQLCANSGGLIIEQNSNFEDGDYLVWGLDTEDNTVNLSDIAVTSGCVVGRWSRTWWLDATDANNPMTTNLTFDYSDAGITSFPDGDISNYSLLYRATNSGNWTVLSTATSVSGDQIKFDNISITADGYYTLATCDIINNPLPIELLEFNAELVENDHVLLNWMTSLEINNDYFEVQKSTNTLDWEIENQIPGQGNSNELSTYSYLDENPYAGVSYYRLKQTDLDGSFSYSDIETINLNGIDIVNTFPNPTNGPIQFTVYSSLETAANFYIFDASGRKIFTKELSLVEGNNEVKLDISDVADGLYIAKVETLNGTYIDKIMFSKQHD